MDITRLHEVARDRFRAERIGIVFQTFNLLPAFSALENVLLPETLARHRQRITGAGFSSCDVWFQCFNFASLIALK